MQGSFRFFKILKKSSPIRTDLPVPNSPARIIIVFLGIPLGRTLSRASIPVSSNPGKLFASPTRLNSHLWKINEVLLGLPTHSTFLEHPVLSGLNKSWTANSCVTNLLQKGWSDYY